MPKKSLVIAIVQEGPAYLDLAASVQKAAERIEAAASKGARLIVFGESWLSGYPAWLDHCPNIGLWDHEATKRMFGEMYKAAVEVSCDEIGRLCRLAEKFQIHICIGINEKVAAGRGNGTLFNSMLIIDDTGRIANHHRKLMPTFTEKLVYGMGDGNGLQAVATPFGRLGSLICWEHWMPMARQSMHFSGEHIHIALWPQVHEMLQLASRSYAFEGRCFVVSVGQILRAKEIPDILEQPKHWLSDPETLVLNGGSSVIAPDGKYLMEPVYEKEEMIIFTIENLDRTIEERMSLDVAGHYSRPDVFKFKKKNRKRE